MLIFLYFNKRKLNYGFIIKKRKKNVFFQLKYPLLKYNLFYGDKS